MKRTGGNFRYFTGNTSHGGYFNFYQGRNGGIYMVMNTKYALLSKTQVEDLHLPVLELEDFDLDAYKAFYAESLTV